MDFDLIINGVYNLIIIIMGDIFFNFIVMDL